MSLMKDEFITVSSVLKLEDDLEYQDHPDVLGYLQDGFVLKSVNILPISGDSRGSARIIFSLARLIRIKID